MLESVGDALMIETAVVIRVVTSGIVSEPGSCLSLRWFHCVIFGFLRQLL
jgi:hypothetical protein